MRKGDFRSWLKDICRRRPAADSISTGQVVHIGGAAYFFTQEVQASIDAFNAWLGRWETTGRRPRRKLMLKLERFGKTRRFPAVAVYNALVRNHFE